MGGGEQRVSALAAVPYGLRVAVLTSGCALLVGAAAYMIVMALARLALLTLAIFAALLLAAAVSPVTSGLRRWKVPATPAALAGVPALLLAISLPLALTGRAVAAQVPGLHRGLEQGLDRVRDFIVTGPLPISQRQVEAAIEGLGQAARQAVPDPIVGAGAAAQVVSAALIALVLLFFVLRDGSRMWRWTLQSVPDRFQPRVDVAARAAWQALEANVRGSSLSPWSTR